MSFITTVAWGLSFLSFSASKPMEAPATPAPITNWSLSPFTTIAQAIDNFGRQITTKPISVGITDETAKALNQTSTNLISATQSIENAVKTLSPNLERTSANLAMGLAQTGKSIEESTARLGLAVTNTGAALIQVSENLSKDIAQLKDTVSKETIENTIKLINSESNKFVKLCAVNGIGTALALAGIVILYKHITAEYATTSETDKEMTVKERLYAIGSSNYTKGTAALIAGLALILKSESIVALAA